MKCGSFPFPVLSQSSTKSCNASNKKLSQVGYSQVKILPNFPGHKRKTKNNLYQQLDKTMVCEGFSGFYCLDKT